MPFKVTANDIKSPTANRYAPRIPLVVTSKELNKITSFVLEWAEKSFKEYALKHGCSQDKLELEWKRFKKILSRNI